MRCVLLSASVLILACSTDSTAWQRITPDGKCVSFGVAVLRTPFEVRAIHGSVVANGQAGPEPIAGIRVIVSPLGGPNAVATEVTDDRGRFAFPPLPAGWYQIQTCKSGWDPVVAAVKVSRHAGDRPIDLHISLAA
jgi:hypothetical protein